MKTNKTTKNNYIKDNCSYTAQKIILLLLVVISISVFLLPTLKPSVASAQSAVSASDRYVRATNSNTPLYADPSPLKTICLLEKSYYLKVLETTTIYHHVQLSFPDKSYPSIVGYVARDAVLLCDYTPTEPIYPTETVVVNSTNANIYFSPLTTSQLILVATNTQKLKYYGSVKSENQLWYYVYFSGTFGYINSNSVTTPLISLHPTPLENIELPPDGGDGNGDGNTNPDPTTPEKNTAWTEIMLLIFVILLSVGLVLVLFVPKKSDKQQSYF